jgi:TRAP-type C4-dicarboxylate transport system permease small subunit
MSEQGDLSAIEGQVLVAPHGAFGNGVNLVAAIGTIWTFLLMFLIVADVIGRSFLSLPITGVAEIAAHSIVAIVFLQLAAGVQSKRMTRADFLIERLHQTRPRLAGLIEAAFLLVGFLLMLFIAYAGWKPMAAAFAQREFFGVQGVFTIPTWPIRAVIVFGALLSASVFLVQTAQQVASLAPRPAAR